ncbi:MAG: helix-turn-helix transcriptional regulator [Pseudonocardiales bacterium]|nr:helix-turn-helix transcriptional regulator [Pseudonocardiales bacterium]
MDEYRIEIEQLRNEFVRILLASSDLTNILCPVPPRELPLTPGIIPPEAAALTARERQILEEYADGHTYEQIAEILFISEKTVRNHVLNAMQKLEISRADGETRFCFAVFISGRHRCPEKLRSRLGLDAD